VTNPVTQHLIGQIDNKDINSLVEHFDVLEVMIIQIYKTKNASRKDERLYRRVKHWMQKHYKTWQNDLEPYWRKTTINNLPVSEDPFLALVEPAKAGDFTDNWLLMQTIPPARQALNEWLLGMVQEGKQ